MRSAEKLRRSEAGGVTVEAAIAIASIVAVVVLCVGAITAVTLHVRCVDSAREAARLTARGDHESAISAAQRVAPDGADVSVRTEGEFVVATVRAHSPLLPLVNISAEAVAALEPTVPGWSGGGR
ncbi:pilus assembly protein TadE [Rhodococcus pseudokoreensis]|uniref:Pilus assembly protein TadE n=1 Tax=Rhodococcus pseudokoreensis TaxID=2811421 RepID=A0A974W4B3_9NOCA|nr:TadE family type IV pilus minor pilin [Rhodococcus pseudokoreensis]QSE91004.1 pilus assembly protein TadE [Rhodococcus pseudokoreensis]